MSRKSKLIAVVAPLALVVTVFAVTAINLDFLDIEGLLVRGASILPSGAGRLKRARPPFRRGATLWAQ